MLEILAVIVGAFALWFALMMLVALPRLLGRGVTRMIESVQKAAH
jgi:hypothetical protein